VQDFLEEIYQDIVLFTSAFVVNEREKNKIRWFLKIICLVELRNPRKLVPQK
jgi:hypothetical protein